MSEVNQIGNICPTKTRDNPNQGRVYDKEGLAPAINCMEGGNREPMIVEINHTEIPYIFDDRDKNFGVKTADICPTQRAERSGLKVIVASRGRNPQNPLDRTAGNYVEQRLESNSGGICNTLTSVQKDNLVLEPTILQSPRGFNKGGEHKISPTISSHSWECNNFVKIKQATRDGCIECKLGGVADLSYSTSKTRRGRVQNNGDISPTLTAGETDICKIETPYRIRKLTPLECWRLMGFSDKDFYKAKFIFENEQSLEKLTKEKFYNILYSNLSEAKKLHHIERLKIKTKERTSNSQLYKQAGNSIVVDVLEAIFKQIL